LHSSVVKALRALSSISIWKALLDERVPSA
jgi:hypothetical protein